MQNVFYNISEFKEAYDELVDKRKPKKIGYFAWHAKFHDGHQSAVNRVVANCDFVVATHYQNFGAEQQRLFGICYDTDKPWTEEDLIPLQYADVAYVQKDDNMPSLDDYYREVHAEFSRLYSNEFLIKEGILNEGPRPGSLYASLRLATYFKHMVHGLYGVKCDYAVSDCRDAWRHVGYLDWLWYKYGCKMDIVNPGCDELGNAISGMKNKLPQHLKDRITKRLLLPTFRHREDVEERIKDIEGLHVGYFFLRKECIQLEFYFEPHQWWSDGVLIE